MKKTLLITFFAIILKLSMSAQFVAKMEVKEEIPGICNKDEVYALIPSFKGQKEAVYPITKEEILLRLNSQVTFVNENPKFKGKGMIGLVINCKGEVIKCKMDNSTKNPELDKQIESVFNTLGTWKAGELDGKAVDSSILFSFNIKNGKFTF